MSDNNRSNEPARGSIGLLLGGVLAVAAALFIMTGGQLGGVKEVRGDADLPAVASPPASSQK